MQECVDAFNNVDWDKLDVSKLRMDWKTVTVQKWNDICDEAAKEMNGNLTKASKLLYEMRDLARDVQAEFKKSKTIPKSSEKHVGEIATTADQFGVSQ